MERLRMQKQRRPTLFTASLMLAGLLVYVGLGLGIDMGLQFNGSGYSFLYYGGVNETDRFVKTKENYLNDAEKEELSRVLERVNLLPSDSTEQKIIKLSKFILDRIDDTRGVPERSWYKKSPYERFQMVWNKQLSGIWCTQFRLVYNLLANEAGIPTRIVRSQIARGPKTNRVKEGKGAIRHNFSESYIIETGQWAHVDLSEKIILPRDADGSFINTIGLYDILMGHKQGDRFMLTTYDSLNQTIQKKHFESRGDLVNFFNEQTAYRFFFQDNQIYDYDVDGRYWKYRYRPYVATLNRVGKKSYALAGVGVSLALVSCIYFVWPLLARVRQRLERSQ